jgi:hypothetical protein
VQSDGSSQVQVGLGRFGSSQFDFFIKIKSDQFGYWIQSDHKLVSIELNTI